MGTSVPIPNSPSPISFLFNAEMFKTFITLRLQNFKIKDVDYTPVKSAFAHALLTYYTSILSKLIARRHLSILSLRAAQPCDIFSLYAHDQIQTDVIVTSCPAPALKLWEIQCEEEFSGL